MKWVTLIVGPKGFGLPRDVCPRWRGQAASDHCENGLRDGGAERLWTLEKCVSEMAGMESLSSHEMGLTDGAAKVL